MRYISIFLLASLTLQAPAAIQKFTLSNGLKVIVKEDHRAPVAVSMIWYNVGSSDEPAGINGVSHFLEHMMFKGTPTHPQGVFSKTIASIGGQENAFTNYDYTAYFEKISAHDLPIALELEADRMRNTVFKEEEFIREMKVVQEERRLRTDDNPQALAFERYYATSHLAYPYQHPVIGWMSDLQQMTMDDAKTWYDNFYAPNNATLVVVGDVNPSKVKDLAQMYFGQIQAKPVFVRKKQPEPPALGPKSVDVYAAAKLPMLIFGYTVPSIMTASTPWEPYALELVSSILDADNSSRLAKNIIRGSKIAVTTDIYFDPFTRYEGQFMFFGVPTRDHQLSEVKSAIIKEINKLKMDLISEQELKRVKTQLFAQKTFDKDSIYGQAMELGMLETIGIGAEEAERHMEKIDAITPAQIQEVVKRYFVDNAVTETRLFPLSPTL